MFASSHRFSIQDGLFLDVAASLGLSDPVVFAYGLLVIWFLIGAAAVYLVAYRPRRRSHRALGWAVSVACGQ